MKLIILSLLFLLCPKIMAVTSEDFYSIKMKSLQNQEVDFSKYKGKVVLAVNTASKCGYTPQFKALQQLQDKYGKQGFEVIGFPSNDFKQEAMSGEKLKKFCLLNYGVHFTMFEKTNVNGEKRNPVFKYLIAQSSTPKEDISWNFEKFLVNQKGDVVGRFKSKVKPMDKEISNLIEKTLK